MLRTRPGLMGGLIIAVLVLLAASGMFALQYAQTYTQCSSVLPGRPSCAELSSLPVAVNSLFAAIAGLLVAMVLAVTVGVGWHRNVAPNSDLARRLEEEQRHVEAYNLRRQKLEEWIAVAEAKAAQKAAQEAAAAAAEAAAQQAIDAELSRWVEEERTDQADDEGQPGGGGDADVARRSKVLYEHLVHLAKVKPEAVAEVIKVWVNQRAP